MAIINREAIALAADSAVSVALLDGTKVYNSANKLFALSQYHPIGIMVYGSAKLTGVPWETLIKIYRKTLGTTKFSKVSDYCNDFLKYLSSKNCFFRDEDELDNVRLIVRHQFELIKQKIRESIKDTIIDKAKTDEKLNESEEGEIINQVIEKAFQETEDKETIDSFSDEFIQNLSKKYYNSIIELIKETFEELKLGEETKIQLVKVAINILTKDEFSPNYSGIVIAGFGDDEVFPDLQAYNIECVLNGKLKYKKDESRSYTSRPHPVIIPFAQGDMVLTFVKGIDPKLEEISRSAMNQTLDNYFNLILNEFKGSSDDEDQIQSLSESLNSTKEKLIENYTGSVNEYTYINYIFPILTAVNILPKEELAIMAESLVSLTSLKRRVSTDQETVGGPTDVALISKGDGFIWVKRKHYFDANLNPSFFANKNRPV